MEIYGICTDIWHQDDVKRIFLKDDDGLITQVSTHIDFICCNIEIGGHYYAKGEDATERMGRPALFADYVGDWGRICSHCGKHHEEGYYSENTCLYACCDECLDALYTEEEIEEEREAEWLFWTEWYN
jgi:hypothetical protein